MEHEAIKEIIGLSSLKAENIAGCQVPLAIVPTSAGVVDLERYMEAPARMRAAFATERIFEFCKYVKAEADSETVVFIRPNARRIEGVIDFGTGEMPQWGSHRAIATIPLTPEFEAISEFVEEPRSQRALIEFLEDWGGILGASDSAGNNLSIAKAISAIRSVTIENVRAVTSEEADFEASASLLEKVGAKGNSQPLPAVIRATCSVLPDTDPRSIELRVAMLTTSDKPYFRIRIVGLELIEKSVAEEVEKLIREELNDVRVYIGELNPDSRW